MMNHFRMVMIKRSIYGLIAEKPLLVMYRPHMSFKVNRAMPIGIVWGDFSAVSQNGFICEKCETKVRGTDSPGFHPSVPPFPGKPNVPVFR